MSFESLKSAARRLEFDELGDQTLDVLKFVLGFVSVQVLVIAIYLALI